MKKNAIILAVLMVFSLATEFVASAGTYKIFGPSEFSRTTAKPVEHKIDFISPFPDPNGKLLIVTGDSDGKHRVSSASVKVNGIQLVGPSDFNKRIDIIEKNLSIELSNTISVEISGAPGDFLSITMEGTPPPPCFDDNRAFRSGSSTQTVCADPWEGRYLRKKHPRFGKWGKGKH